MLEDFKFDINDLNNWIKEWFDITNYIDFVEIKSFPDDPDEYIKKVESHIVNKKGNWLKKNGLYL